MRKRCFRCSAVVLILLILLVMPAGCKKKPTPEAGAGPEEIYRGAEGLKMQFVNNMPPKKIYDTNNMNILLELENKGTSDLSGSRCRLYLSGFDENIIRGMDRERICSSSLEGKSVLNPEGGYSTQEFSTDLIYLPDYLDKLRQTIQVTACYEYQTTASPVVCIDPHLYEIGPIERACVVKDVLMGGGQGAPVAVTKIEERTSPSGNKIKVDFVIYFANKGNGEVSGNVYAGDARLSNVPISCKPESVELKGKEEKSIVCTAETLFSSGAYLAPLSVKLVYDYKLMIDKKLNIRSLK